MPISSNSIFHFTGSKENLINILKTLFKPYYSVETYDFGEKKIKFAIPMVCFCDIPLSQIKNHLNIYGNYGIGMNRSWGIKNQMNPVLYLESNSRLSISLMKSIEDLFDHKSMSEYEIVNNNHFYEILRYIKNYEGNFVYRGKLVKKDYKYYDEKEWRYVPNGIPSYYNVIKDGVKERLNRETDFENFKLHFTPDDIKYLIVESESEIDDLITQLKRVKGGFEELKVDRLISKVLTTEQIEQDF